MKTCKNCGMQYEEYDMACPRCNSTEIESSQKCFGNGDNMANQSSQSQQPEKKLNVFGLAGMTVGIVAFLIGFLVNVWAGNVIGIVGIVFSVLGMCKRKSCSMNAFAIAGLAVSIGSVAFFILYWIILIATVSSLM